MKQELISKKTRNEFREYLVTWILREISMEFDAAGIRCDRNYQPPESSQRRSLVEQYYHTLDFTNPDDVAKLLRAYENVLVKALEKAAEYETGSDWRQHAEKQIATLKKCLQRDGYAFDDGHIVSVVGVPSWSGVKAAAVELNADYLTQQILRIEQSVNSDPSLAIGAAKELVETCCKTVLAERGQANLDKLDLQPLLRRAMEELKLVPEGVPDEAKGAKAIKALLGNLAAMAQSLAEIRNLYGTGHGKEGRAKGLTARHAKLAVGAATTLVTFLFETDRERGSK